MDDSDDGDPTTLEVDPVDHPVGASSGTVSVLEWTPESLADSVRILEQRSQDELVRGGGDRFGQLVGELATGCG
jgi:1,6-anhydro-N-acetylmuramate kinase